MEKAYAKFGDQFEAIAIADIVSDSFSAAFKDVDAVIHTASPIPHKAPAEDILKVNYLILFNLKLLIQKSRELRKGRSMSSVRLKRLESRNS